MVGIVYAAARWINSRNKENVAGLRYELIGDNEHIGIIPRLEQGFNNSIQQVQKDFTTALSFAERERNRLETEIERLRDAEETEHMQRRGRNIRYDRRGAER